MQYKKGVMGYIIIIFFLITFFIVGISYFLMYVQINLQIYGIKDKLFTIVQDSITQFDLESLALYEYQIEENKLKKFIEERLYEIDKNYISDVVVNFDANNNQMQIYFSWRVKPIVSLLGKEEIEVKINEVIKLKMMEW